MSVTEFDRSPLAWKCLELDIEVLCPGHRAPPIDDVPQKCDQMLAHIDAGGHWPLLGSRAEIDLLYPAEAMRMARGGSGRVGVKILAG